MYINKAFVYGNLTRDPELKSLPSGNAVCNFGIATNRYWKDKDGNRQENAEFHNIVAFGKPAELISQYLSKGRPVFIEGRLQTRSWDGNDGQKRYRTEIVVENFQFGAGGPGGGNRGDYQEGANAAPKGNTGKKEELDTIEYPEEDINPEEIPF